MVAKYNLQILLLLFVISITSCKTESLLMPLNKVVVAVQMPDGIKKDIRFANKTVTIRSQRLTYTAITNSQGLAEFVNVVPDIYNVYTSWDLTSEEYVSMADTIVASKPALISGIQSQVKCFDEDSITLETLLSVKQSLLISKVYAATTREPNNTPHESDQYIEIFNNSDELEYLDGIYLALVEGDSPMGFPASANPTTIHARQVYRFPGSGKQYPIEPGKSVVLCNSAVDHTVIAPTSVNLAGSDFEFKGDKYPNSDAVTAMVRIFSSYLAIKEINLQRGGVNSVCLFRTTDDVAGYPVDYIPGKTSGNMFMRINVSAYNVFDGVEILKYKSTGIDPGSKRLQQFIDVGYTNISNSGGYNHESSDRKVDKQRSTAAGRIYLKDTNNSQEDFVTVTDPTPKKYDKPLLLQ